MLIGTRFLYAVSLISQPQSVADLIKFFFGGSMPASVYNIF
jgi:hypothetical protein